MPDTQRRALLTIAAVVVTVITAITVSVAYHAVPGRAFAADDFQWVLNVRDRSLPEVAAQAFDVKASSHFYRPLVWLLLWSEWHLFGFDARAFHVLSLTLHTLNAVLTGALAYRMIRAQSPLASIVGFTGTALFTALHPAPFEAVVWVSAQSELLAAFFLLLASHCWWSARVSGGLSVHRRGWHVAATTALALALLTKESAIIGLPLFALLEWQAARAERRRMEWRPLALPLLVTIAYLVVALDVAARSDLVRERGYSFGVQVALNPLRSLGLIAVPLPGVEYGREAWLPLAGTLVALAGIGALFVCWRYRKGASSLLTGVLALILTLAPTAPFTSSPDSRYLYLPVLVIALLVGAGLSILIAWITKPGSHHTLPVRNRGEKGAVRQRIQHEPQRISVTRLFAVATMIAVMMLLGILAIDEIRGREIRFAAGARPGEELRLFVAARCADAVFERILVVEPPIAALHVEAIVHLSCGAHAHPKIIGMDDVEQELRPNSLVVAFDGGFPHELTRTQAE
ncbi:MAG: hypothetical protein ACUVSY_11205 [Roseiflexus sp.]